jgi:hypothetical protein
MDMENDVMHLWKFFIFTCIWWCLYVFSFICSYGNKSKSSNELKLNVAIVKSEINNSDVDSKPNNA